jgi:hypothetical protein
MKMSDYDLSLIAIENAPSRLLSVKVSSNQDKKFDATFIMRNGKYKTVSFGASGYQDMTTIKDSTIAKAKKDLYILRHQKRETILWNTKPDSPAALSRWILWEFQDIEKAISNFKNKFSLK